MGVDMDDELDYEDEDSGRGIDFRRILFIGLVIIPLIVFIILYMRNATVKSKTNNLLSKIPGPIGTYFKGSPTEAENRERVNYLANHFIGLEPEVAADKIYIIKTEDEKLYNQIIKAMNKLSTEKTEEIVLLIRDMEMRDDLLSSIYDTAKEESADYLASEAARLESQDDLTTKREIERRFSSKEFQEVLDGVREERLAEILYYTDPDIRNFIIGKFNNKKKIDVELEISKVAKEKETLIDLAKYYETKKINDAIEALGNTDTYSMDKLATIFSNMSVLKSSMILTEVDDNEFIEELFTAISTEQALLDNDRSVMQDISRSIDFLEAYYEKTENLVKVYEEMNSAHVASIVERMVMNDESVTIFNLDVEETYELSDKVIIIDILSGMKKDSLSKVLDAMDTEKASLVTQLLAKPEERTFGGGEELEIDEQDTEPEDDQ